MPDPVTPPRYLTAALAVAADAAPGQLIDVFVFHDDGCPRLLGGPCACNPTVTRGFTLWHRKGRRAKWEAIATRPIEAQALAAMRTSGKRGGDWLTLPAGRRPRGARP